MENLINTITSNPVYMIITGILVVLILFLLIKKLFKIFVFVCILFILFLAYVRFSGGNVKETIKEIKDKGQGIIK